MSDSFIADLHIHSKYSRATARNLDLENIYIWAQLKGITVVGTGDFTHPEWLVEIGEKLEPAEPGLYRLKKDIARRCDEAIPSLCRAPVRFVLSSEISNIYKKKDRTRKNHNLVFFPDLQHVRQFNARLDAIGNLKSDGRPILGLDARDLLEIVLETSDDGYLVPAHIWTPWFSMLGSKSGFDSIQACFNDLSGYIFAAETGLSSDPAMNWRVADLDGITLISNSDAHSPAKLGREANMFHTPLDYFSMRSAMQRGDRQQFAGTFEFYPEEGKYHVDGHRKCGVSFSPAETRSYQGICPVCEKPLTLGVLHRVEDLATRPEGVRPDRAVPFFRLIPLENLLAEIFKVGSQTKKVQKNYRALLDKLGSEFQILHYLDRETIESSQIPLLGEAIERMRDNRVSFSPGYDGVFGSVTLFTEQERSKLLGQRHLFTAFEMNIDTTKDTASDGPIHQASAKWSGLEGTGRNRLPVETVRLNTDQQRAVDCLDRALMIVAGPGTGKTRTVTHKIAGLIETGSDAKLMIAMTFTNKAAEEMRLRLKKLLNGGQLPFVGTFHALGYTILSDTMGAVSLGVIDEKTRRSLIRDALALNGLTKKEHGITVDELMGWIVAAKQNMCSHTDLLATICPEDKRNAFATCYRTYQQLLRIGELADFEDLIFRTVRLLETDTDITDRYKGRFSHIFIDEYQDINVGQYRLVRLLAGPDATICIIGDPDQSIYGFRGSDIDCFKWFKRDYPHAKTIFLGRNYRSNQTILDVSAQIIKHNPDWQEIGQRQSIYSRLNGDRTIQLLVSSTAKAEAVAIGKVIERMVGGTGFLSLDSGAVDSRVDNELVSFADVAVLFRTRSQGDLISRTLEQAGIPCQVADRQTIMDHSGIGALISIYKLIHGIGLFNDIDAAASLRRMAITAKSLEILKSWAYRNDLSASQALLQARRVPIPQMGRHRQQRLYDFSAWLMALEKKIKRRTTGEAIDILLDAVGIGDRFEHDATFASGYRQLLDIAGQHPHDPGAFAAAAALCSHTDMYRQNVEKVALMTMHTAKGLEFEVVFIAGCEAGWIPYHSDARPANPEEERRLFYVATTRAKQQLFLTRATRRRVHGQMQARRWSPFVNDIDLRYKQISLQSGKERDRPIQQQLDLF